MPSRPALRRLALVHAALLLLAGCNCDGLTLAILTQPADQSVVAGTSATFTVRANEAATGYQWQRDTGSGFADVAGATEGTYHTGATTLAMSGTRFRVVVAGVGQATLTSSVATLTVTSAAVAPTIVTSPANLTVDEGQPASFSVTASGTPTPALQWRRAWSEGGFMDLAGQTGSTLTLAAVAPGDTGARFLAVAFNDAGVALSGAATLTVRALAAPVITLQPADLTVDSGTPATFTVVATGVPAPTYQWRDGTSLVPFDGGTGASFTFPAPTYDDTGATVQVVVTNSRGSVTSAVATLTVLPAPLTGFSEVSIGFDATVGLKNGTVHAWGDNNHGQLGRPGTTADGRPRPVAGLSGTFLHVLMRGETGYALRDDHTVWAWGSNSHGQLGNPSVAVNTKSATAVQVLRASDHQPLTGIVALAANDADSGGAEGTAFGLTATGALWVWGSAYVEPGTPPPSQPSHLEAVPNPYFDGSTPAQTVKLLSVGSISGYVVAGDDSLYTWVRVVPGVTTTVTKVNLAGPFLDLSVSWGTAFVVNSSHELWDVLPTVPAKVPLAFAVDAIRTGQHGSLTVARRADNGALYAWGAYGQAGQYGDGTATNGRGPADAVPVLGITDATLLAVGQESALVLRPGGAVWGWGGNGWGELGTTPASVPTYRLSPYPLTGL